MSAHQSNEVALVTGGNRGLGKDIVLSLARMGMAAALTYNVNQQEADDAKCLTGQQLEATGGFAL